MCVAGWTVGDPRVVHAASSADSGDPLATVGCLLGIAGGMAGAPVVGVAPGWELDPKRLLGVSLLPGISEPLISTGSEGIANCAFQEEHRPRSRKISTRGKWSR